MLVVIKNKVKNESVVKKGLFPLFFIFYFKGHEIQYKIKQSGLTHSKFAILKKNVICRKTFKLELQNEIEWVMGQLY